MTYAPTMESEIANSDVFKGQTVKTSQQRFALKNDKQRRTMHLNPTDVTTDSRSRIQEHREAKYPAPVADASGPALTWSTLEERENSQTTSNYPGFSTAQGGRGDDQNTDLTADETNA